MTVAGILSFWAIAALAAWVQTMTDFALGLILMGGVAMLGLMPVPEAAIITSILVLVNATLILSRGWREVDRPALIAMLIGALPGIIGGYLLLHWLAGSAIEALRLLLGLTILGAVIQMIRSPHSLPVRQSDLSFGLWGFAGGLLGGLFATSGPPVIWHLYRQPMPLAQIKVTLVSFFALTQAWRLGLAGVDGALSNHVLLVAAGAVPSVLAATWLARNHPPNIAPQTVRKLAIALLFVNSLTLIITAGLALTSTP